MFIYYFELVIYFFLIIILPKLKYKYSTKLVLYKITHIVLSAVLPDCHDYGWQLFSLLSQTKSNCHP